MPKLYPAINKAMRFSHKAVLAALMFGAVWLAKPADASAVILYLTFQVPSQFAGTEFDYGDIIRYDTDTGQSSLYFKADDHFIGKEGHAMDALEVLPDGTILFSTVGGGKLPGIPNKFNYSDLIHYDPVNHIGMIVMAGRDHFETKAGKPTQEQLDVVDVLPDGSFLFSTRYEAIFDGNLFDQDDVFRYDPVSGAVSLFFDAGILETGPQGFNLDGFDIMPDGRYLLSIFKTREVGELKITGADLVIYDPNTGKTELFLDHDDILDWKGKHRNFTGVDTEPEVPQQLPVIPEPTSASLLGLGLLGTLLRRRKRLKS